MVLVCIHIIFLLFRWPMYKILYKMVQTIDGYTSHYCMFLSQVFGNVQVLPLLFASFCTEFCAWTIEVKRRLYVYVPTPFLLLD